MKRKKKCGGEKEKKKWLLNQVKEKRDSWIKI